MAEYAHSSRLAIRAHRRSRCSPDFHHGLLAARSQPAELPRLLDAYADGRFDEALEPVRRASKDQSRALRRALTASGTLWVNAVPADRARRTLVVAAFALETEIVAAERGE